MSAPLTHRDICETATMAEPAPKPRACARKGCTQDLGDDPDRCELCRQEFCADDLQRSHCGCFRLCDGCVAKQQEIIRTSTHHLMLICAKAVRGEFLTDEELRERVERWRTGL